MSHGSTGSRSQAAEGVVRPSALATSFEWLISPVGKQSFFQDYWEKKPLVVSREQRHYFESLFSLDEADRVLTTLDRRYPDVTLKNANREMTGDSYTDGVNAFVDA